LKIDKETKKRIIIAGPTASGKSSLAIQLAERVDGEIISVDSRQCFKRINIGTAKPNKEDLRRIRHYNISVLDFSEEDTVADFKKRSEQYTSDIERRGKTVIYCGGSTLHLQSLIQPLDDLPEADDENIKLLNKKAKNKGIKHLFEQLKNVDPEYAERMDGLNRQRIIRALDVWHQTGKPFSSFHSNDPISLPQGYCFFALHHPRNILHQRISERTEQMVRNGLVEETDQLLKNGYSPKLQAFHTVGYKEALQFLAGQISKKQMIEDIKTSTRRYAKRQITWLRRWPFVEWIDMDKKSNEEAVSQIIDAQKKM